MRITLECEVLPVLCVANTCVANNDSGSVSSDWRN